MNFKNKATATILRWVFPVAVLVLLISANPHAPTGSAQSLSPALPSKEYLYVGSKLLAVEVPDRPEPLVFCGAETGDFGELTSVIGTKPSVVTSPVRSGNYAYKMEIATNDIGYATLSFPPTPEVWVSIYARAEYFVSGGGYIYSVDASTGAGLALIQYDLPVIYQPFVFMLETEGQYQETTVPVYDDQWYQLEVHYKAGTGANAIVELKVNGQLAARITTGIATADAARIKLWGMFESPLYFDDIRVYTNKWPGDGAVLSLRPDSVGDEDNATGSFADIDDQPPNDATFRRAPGSGAASFLNNLGSIGSVGMINGAKVVARASRTGGQGRSHYIRAKKTGTTAENSPPLGLTQTVNYYEFVPSLVNQPQSQAELDTFQVGMSQDSAGGQKYECSEMWLMVDHSP